MTPKATRDFSLEILAYLDIFKYMIYDFGNDSPLVGTKQDVKQLTSQGWLGISPFSGQMGLEFGFKWTQGFFVKGEVGYSLLAFDNFKCDREDCGNDIENNTLHLTAPYALLGLGWFFH